LSKAPLRDLWQRWRASQVRRRIERETQASLRGLDGHMLHDLGLDRSQIESIAVAAAGLVRERQGATLPELNAQG
jgi:uncharacterized protein YjiS (DUF1127 family)